MKHRAPLVDEAGFVGTYLVFLLGASLIGEGYPVLGSCLLLGAGVGLIWELLR